MTDEVIEYYRKRINDKDRTDFLWQVGKTIGGHVVEQGQVDMIIQSIRNNLQLDSEDVVLDIGSGNGLITKEISKFVASVKGLELSSDLFDIATEYNSASNVVYLNHDVLKIDDLSMPEKFTKIYLYEVIQHFSYSDLDRFFSLLKANADSGTMIYLGGVLDADKRWDFFDTPERKREYFEGEISGVPAIGYWYDREFFSYVAHKYGMTAQYVPQDNNLYTSHYRYDCLLSIQ